MSDRKKTPPPDADAAAVVSLDRVRDKLLRKRQDEHAAALAAQFHTAMGWQGKPDTPGGKKGKRKKKTK